MLASPPTRLDALKPSLVIALWRQRFSNYTLMQLIHSVCTVSVNDDRIKTFLHSLYSAGPLLELHLLSCAYYGRRDDVILARYTCLRYVSGRSGGILSTRSRGPTARKNGANRRRIWLKDFVRVCAVRRRIARHSSFPFSHERRRCLLEIFMGFHATKLSCAKIK